MRRKSGTILKTNWKDWLLIFAVTASMLVAAGMDPPRSQAAAGDEYWSGVFAANGTNGTVFALAADGQGNLYVGGEFTEAGGLPAKNIARWNNGWSPLGEGINGPVNALAIDSNGTVYAGGSFTNAGSVIAANIAAWNGSAWSPLGSGTTAPVKALAVGPGGLLYAGGHFLFAGGNLVNSIARWNGNVWSGLVFGLDTGTNGSVLAMAFDGSGALYAGGLFTNAGGVPAKFVARWSSGTWSSLGTNIQNGTSGPVEALAVDNNGILFVGGNFDKAGGTIARYVARWNGSSWGTVGVGPDNGTNDPVHALSLDGNGNLYVGGDFIMAGTVQAPRIARWNGSAWENLNNGPDNSILALQTGVNGYLYAGGSFTDFTGFSPNHIVCWKDLKWTALGNGVNGYVSALAVDSQNQLLAAGDFNRAGGVPTFKIAAWDGQVWQNRGLSSFEGIYDIKLGANDTIYAALKDNTGNSVYNYTAPFWNRLGNPGLMDNTVSALALDNSGTLFAGGFFTTLDVLTVNHLARWDGLNWSALGWGLNGPVFSLIVDSNGHLMAGGISPRPEGWMPGISPAGTAPNGTLWAAESTVW